MFADLDSFAEMRFLSVAYRLLLSSKSYKENQVTLTYSLSKNEAGHNDE